jgi:hypothetical protein
MRVNHRKAAEFAVMLAFAPDDHSAHGYEM